MTSLLRKSHIFVAQKSEEISMKSKQQSISFVIMLRSAVGKTHVLRSRLVMNSEIDHIHLSSEAHRDSHLLPPGGLPQ